MIEKDEYMAPPTPVGDVTVYKQHLILSERFSNYFVCVFVFFVLVKPLFDRPSSYFPLTCVCHYQCWKLKWHWKKWHHHGVP
mmetsp:Transcript_3674/g.5397  ORF Transcript_3674/g.5397 Transcript_3674/m.5397 type:complete len:82 (+) Transcript_3674:43-288(+)